MLKIYKASAGSGKTYKLALEYISILISSYIYNREKYQNVLAVTFTNKATNEMKERILDFLGKISLLSDESLLKNLKETLRNSGFDNFSDEKIQSIAGEILNSILHDYSNFAVSTIDSFFQRTMRAFARELGFFPSYNVELDSDDVINRAVDNFISSLDNPENEHLIDWLYQLSLDNIYSGKSWDFTPGLNSMAKKILSDDYKVKSRAIEPSKRERLFDREYLKEYKSKLKAILNNYINKSQEIATTGLSIIERNGLNYSDFKGGSRSPLKKIYIWADNSDFNNDSAKLTATFLNLYDDISNWYSKTSNKKDLIQQAYNDGLDEVVSEMIRLYNEELPIAKTANLIIENLYSCGVFSEIRATLRNYLKENNIVLLSETNDVLNRIIDNSDTPFIYEKIGTKYENYLLDEFQDTSTLQWENFKPLVANALASSNTNLIVGDTKQSIYRWRGSSWQLFENQVEQDLQPAEIKNIQIDSNYRSGENIIAFNNAFYEYAAKELQDKYNQLLFAVTDRDLTNQKKITDIYTPKNIHQFASSNKGQGHICIRMIDREKANGADVNELIISSLKNSIDRLISNGFTYKDILVLVRKRDDGALIARDLIANGYNIITDEALLIDSSKSVKQIVALLKFIYNPEDLLNSAELDEQMLDFDIEESSSTSIYDLCEKIIREMGDNIDRSEYLYIQSFLDLVLDFISKNGSNLAQFLTWWDETGVTKSIPSSTDNNAIQIMTVHKAKGLSSKAVIVPFFSFELEQFNASGNDPQKMWVSTDCETLSEIGIIPVKIKKDLADTLYKDYYLEEIFLNYIDNLNLSYVATTRAEQEMIIIGAIRKDCASINDYLLTFLQNNNSVLSADYQSHIAIDRENGDYEDIWNIGEWQYANGVAEKDKITTSYIDFDHTISIPLDNRLKMRLRSADFFEGSNRVKGIVLHDILSSVDCPEDLERSIADAITSGELPIQMKESVQNQLSSLIDSVSDRHWFDGNYTSLKEVSIIDSNGDIYRPDRVLIDESNAIIIDYKFGEQKYHSYQTQVRCYMHLLSSMGFNSVKGYIWYALLGEIVEVDF